MFSVLVEEIPGTIFSSSFNKIYLETLKDFQLSLLSTRKWSGITSIILFVFFRNKLKSSLKSLLVEERNFGLLNHSSKTWLTVTVRYVIMNEQNLLHKINDKRMVPGNIKMIIFVIPTSTIMAHTFFST